MMLNLFWVIVDVLMVWWNIRIYKKELSTGWKYVWAGFIVFWIANIPFDLIELFGGK